MPRPIQATIHTEALRHNLARMRAAAPDAKVWAVVKANAYGHGIERVYEALPGRGARTVHDLAVDAGLVVPQVMGQLALLELEGLVRRENGRWRLA